MYKVLLKKISKLDYYKKNEMIARCNMFTVITGYNVLYSNNCKQQQEIECKIIN